MKSFAFGQYYPAESLIHRIDPRVKVILTVLFIVCTFLCRNAVSFLALTVLAVLLILFSRIPLRLVLGTMKPLILILIFTSAINIFTTRGEQLLTPETWKIRIYAEGLWNAAFMVLRIVILLAGTGIFLSFTTTPIALTDALEQLFSPLKKLHVPVHEIAMMTTIALRFIPTLMEETEKIMNAQKARGADFTSGNLVRRAKALLPVLIPLLISAFNRAYELATAMECRCYHGGEGRTRLKVPHLRFGDVLALILLLAAGTGLFFLNRLGIGYTMR